MMAIAHWTTIDFSSLLEPLLFLAQVDDDKKLSERLFTDLTLRKLFRAAVTIAIAYGSFFVIQAATAWISERVARRFRLTIKQALPFWKALILNSYAPGVIRSITSRRSFVLLAP